MSDIIRIARALLHSMKGAPPVKAPTRVDTSAAARVTSDGQLRIV